MKCSRVASTWIRERAASGLGASHARTTMPAGGTKKPYYSATEHAMDIQGDGYDTHKPDRIAPAGPTDDDSGL
jgi:hypothetical protein